MACPRAARTPRLSMGLACVQSDAAAVNVAVYVAVAVYVMHDVAAVIFAVAVILFITIMQRHQQQNNSGNVR